MRVPYPRTPHLPWSPGASADDVRVGGLGGFVGREVVVTEKLDGENTTLYADGLHARSVDSAHHPSRAWLKALHGRIADRIPAGWRVCGENLYARHSIPYDTLDGYRTLARCSTLQGGGAGDRVQGSDNTAKVALSGDEVARPTAGRAGSQACGGHVRPTLTGRQRPVKQEPVVVLRSSADRNHVLSGR